MQSNAFVLCVDHVQSDPYASPSRIRVEVSLSMSHTAGIPPSSLETIVATTTGPFIHAGPFMRIGNFIFFSFDEQGCDSPVQKQETHETRQKDHVSDLLNCMHPHSFSSKGRLSCWENQPVLI